MQEFDGVVCTGIADDCDLVLAGSDDDDDDDDDYEPKFMFGEA